MFPRNAQTAATPALQAATAPVHAVALQVAEEAGWCYSPRGRGRKPRYGLLDLDGLGLIRETVARVAGVDADTLPDLINYPLSGPSFTSLHALFVAMGLSQVTTRRPGDIIIYATHDDRHEPAVVLPAQYIGTRGFRGKFVLRSQMIRQAWGRPITRAWLERPVVAVFRINPSAVRAAATVVRQAA